MQQRKRRESGGLAMDAAVHLFPDLMPVMGAVLDMPETLQITSPSSLPPAIAGEYYEYQMLAAGGREPYTWRLQGLLPTGMTLSPTGLLSGTSPNPGQASPIIHCDSADGQTDSGSFTLAVQASTFGVDSDGDGNPDTVIWNGPPTVSVDTDSINIDTDGDGDADIVVPR